MLALGIIFQSMKDKKSSSDHTLESFKLYPYVAWALIIGFAVFVYTITTNLKAAASDLQIQSELSDVQTPPKPSQIKSAPEASQADRKN